MNKLLSSEYIYKGKILNLRKDKININSKVAIREVVEHHGGAAIALKKANGKYLLVKQFRYGQQMDMIEFVAGKLELGENPLEAIIREASEESGFTVKNIKPLGFIAPTPAYDEEKTYLYYGECDEYVGQNLDEDEDIALLECSLDELETMIKNFEIQDAKTLAICYYLRLLNL